MHKSHRFGVSLCCGVALLMTALSAPSTVRAADPTPLTSKEIDKRVATLLKQMTLEEKIGQLAQFSAGSATGPDNARINQKDAAAKGGLSSVLNLSGAKATNDLQREAVEKSRLHIPILFSLDVIHGYRTVYPIPLGLSAAWDPALAGKCARMAAVEATSEGIRWTFSPMVDIARDARWGRITEGNGEDPYLGEAMAAAWVRGYQGSDLTDSTAMLACVKHFVGYGGAEGGRDYNGVDMSERVLRDVYLPPFKAAVDAGAGTFMSAFNTLDGVPTSANPHTLTDILRTEWKFGGFVVSDWDSIGELIPHGVALDGSDAARKALSAGVDMDMQAALYTTKLAELVRTGKVKTSTIDQSVARILRLKFALGLFEHPYTDKARSATVMLTPEHLATARTAAEESFVLLKNDAVDGKALLPLTDGKTVALIGSLADDKGAMFGAWTLRGRSEDVVTLHESLAERLKDKLVYVKGVEPKGDSEEGFAEALAAANKADVVIMALGETADMSGEAHSRANLDLPGKQQKLLQAVVATGKPVVLVLFNGRPLALPWESAHVPAILEAWFPGVQTGPALARTLFGESNPGGRLTTSFPYSAGQMPLYYNTFSTGRPSRRGTAGEGYVTGYIDQNSVPLFPFGYGLSYTTFEYTAPTITTQKISAAELNKNVSIIVEGSVKNTGTRAGSEVVQLYIRERGTSVARPIRELKGFQKIVLAPGESRPVRFVLSKKELSFWNIDNKQMVEPCELTVWIAPHAQGGESTKLTIAP